MDRTERQLFFFTEVDVYRRADIAYPGCWRDGEIKKLREIMDSKKCYIEKDCGVETGMVWDMCAESL